MPKVGERKGGLLRHWRGEFQGRSGSRSAMEGEAKAPDRRNQQPVCAVLMFAVCTPHWTMQLQGVTRWKFDDSFASEYSWLFLRLSNADWEGVLAIETGLCQRASQNSPQNRTDLGHVRAGPLGRNHTPHWINSRMEYPYGIPKEGKVHVSFMTCPMCSPWGFVRASPLFFIQCFHASQGLGFSHHSARNFILQQLRTGLGSLGSW